MTLRYPYAPLAIGGFTDPADGEVPRETDFNRLYQEINAIEATLGPNVRGTGVGTLVSRLSQDCYHTPDSNGDGYVNGMVFCEKDPTGAKRGTRRWMFSKNLNFSFAAAQNVGEVVQSFPFNIFDLGDDNPPAVFVSAYVSLAIAQGGSLASLGTFYVQAGSPALARIKAYPHGSNTTGPQNIAGIFFVLAIGGLEVIDDLAPYCWKMDRVGGE